MINSKDEEHNFIIEKCEKSSDKQQNNDIHYDVINIIILKSFKIT